MHKLNKTGIIVLKHKFPMLESTAHVLKAGLKPVNVSKKKKKKAYALACSLALACMPVSPPVVQLLTPSMQE